MGLMQFILICVVVGLVVWAVHSFTPIPAQIKNLILWVAVAVLVLILLSALGVFQYDIPIPRLR